MWHSGFSNESLQFFQFASDKRIPNGSSYISKLHRKQKCRILLGSICKMFLKSQKSMWACPLQISWIAPASLKTVRATLNFLWVGYSHNNKNVNYYQLLDTAKQFVHAMFQWEMQQVKLTTKCYVYEFRVV